METQTSLIMQRLTVLTEGLLQRNQETIMHDWLISSLSSRGYQAHTLIGLLIETEDKFLVGSAKFSCWPEPSLVNWTRSVMKWEFPTMFSLTER